MDLLLYLRLIGYTFGTLIQLFWMVVILGYRRQRNFERVFFFLCLALFLFYSGSLLELNAQIHYTRPPAVLEVFAAVLLLSGVGVLPPLLVHLHLEYAETRHLVRRKVKRLWLAAFYAPLIYLALRTYSMLASGGAIDFEVPARSLGKVFGIWLAASLLVSMDLERRLANIAPDLPQRLFHRIASGFIGLAAILVLSLHVFHITAFADPEKSTLLAFLPLVPMAVLIYMVERFNFLQIGRQKNLVYAVTVTFLALLYLSLVRRVGVWLEPGLPPEATAAVMVFVLVIFFEPLQRLVGRSLRATAQSEMDHAQRMVVAIQDVARQGNSAKLGKFIEEWVGEELGLAEVKLWLFDESAEPVQESVPNPEENSFSIRQGGRWIGALQVKSHGAMLSGETTAALEFLCEQLPGALDLCRLIEEKLRLERELAERERLALVGQMAASISHNLKNPLGSMKTILQVQLENPELPDSIRGETKMVLDEISRLSTKLNQLLQFSRPAVRGGNGTGSSDAATVVEEVAGVLSREAERRGLELQTETSVANARVAISAEALNDIVSNLVVNALEAASRGGHVSAAVAREGGNFCVLVEDDGPGIPAALREKILQPFFTTKSRGTGLGLAIVARRVAEFGGKMDWESPVKNGHGTRFKVTLPAEDIKK